jgi:hypothetical protein
MSLITRLLIVSALSASLFAQHGHRDPSPEDRNANPDRALVVPKVDSVQALRDSQDLLSLSQSVSSDVRAVAGGGMVRKDLRERLKRIEKLSKKLRNDLLLD